MGKVIRKSRPFKCLWKIGDAVKFNGGRARMLVVDFGHPGDVVVSWRDQDGVHELTVNKLDLTEY